MNQECIGCPQGTQMRAKIIEAHVRREESQTTLDALDAQIAECTTLQIMSGVRRRLRQNRTTYLTEVYLPASHDYVMSIPLSGRLEQCPGPFDPAAFGIQIQKKSRCAVLRLWVSDPGLAQYY